MGAELEGRQCYVYQHVIYTPLNVQCHTHHVTEPRVGMKNKNHVIETYIYNNIMRIPVNTNQIK